MVLREINTCHGSYLKKGFEKFLHKQRLAYAYDIIDESKSGDEYLDSIKRLKEWRTVNNYFRKKQEINESFR